MDGLAIHIIPCLATICEAHGNTKKFVNMTYHHGAADCIITLELLKSQRMAIKLWIDKQFQSCMLLSTALVTSKALSVWEGLKTMEVSEGVTFTANER